MRLKDGWIVGVERVPSPHFDDRPDGEEPSLLVVHNISLAGRISASFLPGHYVPMSILFLLKFSIYVSQHTA